MAGAKPPLRIAIVALSLGLLLGCSHSPPTRFFTLDPITPMQPAKALSGPPLRIDHVSIPSVMDRPELVREYAADQLKVDDFNHWGAPLGDLMRATLVEDLTTRLASGRVLPVGTPIPRGGADLTVEVAAIHEGAGSLVADIDWTLSQSQAGAATAPSIIRTIRHERIEAALNSGSQQAFAAALSQVMGALADRIVAALPAS
jgi:uncharacterized lipoprotein YmbA